MILFKLKFQEEILYENFLTNFGIYKNYINLSNSNLNYNINNYLEILTFLILKKEI